MENLIFRHTCEAMAIGRFPVHTANDRWYLRHINIRRYQIYENKIGVFHENIYLLLQYLSNCG